jgi:hypothetical protein
MDTRKSIFQCAAVLLAGHIFFFWLWYYSPLTVPAMIPGTPINIHGLVLILFLVGCYLIFFKRILHEMPETSLATLTLIGGLAQLFSEAIFQLIRQTSYKNYTPLQHVYEYLGSVVFSTVMAVIIAFLIAYQMKRRRILMLLLFLGLAIVVFNLLTYILPS